MLLEAELLAELVLKVFTYPLSAVLSSSVDTIPELEVELVLELEPVLVVLAVVPPESEEDESSPQPVSMMAAEIKERIINIWMFLKVIALLRMGFIYD